MQSIKPASSEMRAAKLTIAMLGILFLVHCKGNVSVNTEESPPNVETYLNGVRIDQNSSLQLGNILQNSPAQTYPLVIRNNSSGKLTLTQGNISINTNAAYALSGLNFPIELAAKAEVAGVLIVNPLVPGTMHFSLKISTDHALLPSLTVNCMLAVTSVPLPEIAVQQGVANLNTGGAYNFGTVLTGSANSISFTVFNLGTANLNIGGTPTAQILGADAADFTVTTFPASMVAPLANTTITVQQNSTTPGAKTAYLRIVSNDADEAVFILNLSASAQVPTPEINLTQSSVSYLSGSTYTYNSTTAGGTYDATFTIQNLGTAPLTLSGAPLISLSGTDAADFSVQTLPSSPVAVSGSTSFTIRFRPTSAGARSASFTISNSDSNEATYQVFLSSTVTAPEIAVRWSLNTGSIYATSGATLNLGFTDTGDGETRSFFIENTGNQALNLSGSPAVQITGAHASDFSVATAPPASMPAGTSGFFSILVKPSAVGTRTATLTIPNNDYDEGPFVIHLTISGSAFVQKAPLANYWKARAGAKTVEFDNKIFLFSGWPSDVWSSADGITWKCRNAAPGWGINLQAAIVHQGKILVFDGSKIWQSFDGVNYSVAVASPPWGDRTGMGVVSLGGTIYLFGGYTSWNSLNYNDVWTSADGINWSKISNSSAWAARSTVNATVHSGKIFLVGGGSARDVWTTTNGMAWTQESNNNIPVRNYTANVSFGAKLYLYGGSDNSGVSYADVYSTTTGASFTLETTLPGFAPRTSHTALPFAGKVFLMTGNAASSSQRDVYQSSNGVNFTQLEANADIFEPRWAHRVVNLNGKLILTGGRDVLSNHKNDSWTSTDGVTWSVANGNTPWSARRGHTLTVHNNIAYLIAGGTAASVGNVNREVWQTSDGINYTLLTSNPAFPARFHHTAVSFAGKLWIFGGTNAANAQLNDAWTSTDGINWTQVANIPLGLEGATMTVHAGELYLAAGYCAACTPTYRNTVYKSTDGLVWTTVTGASGYASVGQLAVSYANKLWFFGGSTTSRYSQAAFLLPGAVHQLTTNSPLGARDNAGYALFNDGTGEKLWVFGGGVDVFGISNDIMTMEALP